MSTRQMKKKVLLVIFLLFFFQLFTSRVVGAKEKEYPEKEIRFLTGFVGGFTDFSARALSKVAPKYLGKPVVVVTMPGGASAVAYNELVNSPPDGHTIGWITTGYNGITIHQQKVPFDPKVLKTVLGFTSYRQGLYVRGDSPYAKLEDFIAYGQKNPGAIKYGHQGKGIPPHLIGELFFRSANIKAIDVPFKGSPEIVQAVIGGHIMSGIGGVGANMPLFRAGTLKLVVTFVNQGLEEFPEVPSSKEKGYADLDAFNTIVYVCIHRDTPLDRFQKLHDALKKAVEDPEFKKILGEMGEKGGYIPPETVEETISETAKLAVPLLKELKLFAK